MKKYCNHYLKIVQLMITFLKIEDIDNNFDNDDNNPEESQSREFVSASLPSPNENRTIANTLIRMQNNDSPIMWPNIDENPINEFQISGYIARAFLTLYSTGNADLCSEYARDIKPVNISLICSNIKMEDSHITLADITLY